MHNKLPDNVQLIYINGNFLHGVKSNHSATLRFIHPNYDPSSNSYQFDNAEDFEEFAKLIKNRFSLEPNKKEPTEKMATPAFIYAFDNLGPYRFTELCGLLLGSRYKGFVLGGVGPDGKIDGEVANVLDSDVDIENVAGLWTPEHESPLNDMLIRHDETVIFQFKHIVISRAGGQSKARQRLLSLYKNSMRNKSEVLSPLISKKKPSAYVLVTNIEINSNFRSELIDLCNEINPNIRHYHIIGLDDLEAWITNEKHIRHLYLPTIFGRPRFNLKVQFSLGFYTPIKPENTNFTISVLNTGEATSYIDYIAFKLNIDGSIQMFQVIDKLDAFNNPYNPKVNSPVEPGRKLSFTYPINTLMMIKNAGNKVFPIEIIVKDELGNEYRCDFGDFGERVRNMVGNA